MPRTSQRTTKRSPARRPSSCTSGGTACTCRCAVYTRKSSEEGLEQEFNSLDAQREACLAYVASQRHEGWTALPDRYDDGGFPGGTPDRPALQRLLADVGAGRMSDTRLPLDWGEQRRALGFAA